MRLHPAPEGWVSDPFQNEYVCHDNTEFTTPSVTYLSPDASKGWTPWVDQADIDRKCPGPGENHFATWTMVRK